MLSFEVCLDSDELSESNSSKLFGKKKVDVFFKGIKYSCFAQIQNYFLMSI